MHFQMTHEDERRWALLLLQLQGLRATMRMRPAS
jgi:hypothetical protein